MKTQSITHLQFLLWNSKNERQKAAIRVIIAAYQKPNKGGAGDYTAIAA